MVQRSKQKLKRKKTEVTMMELQIRASSSDFGMELCHWNSSHSSPWVFEAKGRPLPGEELGTPKPPSILDPFFHCEARIGKGAKAKAKPKAKSKATCFANGTECS